MPPAVGQRRRTRAELRDTLIWFLRMQGGGRNPTLTRGTDYQAL